ncbi:MAG: hypothetical protein ACK5Y2_04890 [Bdellovibrionales bacterium]
MFDLPKRDQKILDWVLLIFLYLSPSRLLAQDFSLEQFRQAVSASSSKSKMIEAAIKGATFEQKQAENATAPQGFAEYVSSQDKSPNLTPEFSGTERNGDELKVGLQSQTALGIKPRVFAFNQNQRVLNISSLPNPNLSLQRRGAGIEADISLWKNRFGKDVRGQISSSQATSQALLYQAEASKLVFELEADVLYFETSFLKQAILIQEDLVQQGEKLMAWTKSQAASRLLEPVHVAQAKASLQARKLSLVSLKQQLRSNLI